MKNQMLSIVLACGLVSEFASALLAVPAPIHRYEFSGNLTDTGSGTPIAVESGGGTIGAGVYQFQPTPAAESSATRGDNNPDAAESYNQGLTLRSTGIASVLTNSGVYTIEMRFRLHSIPNITPSPQPWVKIIDFKNRAFDDGFYTEDASSFDVLGQSAYIEYFGAGGAMSASPVVQPDQWLHLVIARNAAGAVAAYANGGLAFSAADAAGDLIFSGPNNVMRFFQDDLASPNYIRDFPSPPGPPQTDVFESAPGEIDFLRIYDSNLTPADAAALYAASVPEPSTAALALLSMAGVSFLAHKRRGRIDGN